MFKLEGSKVYLSEFTEKEKNNKSYYEWLRDYSIVRNIYRLEYLKPISRETICDYVDKIIKSPNDSLFAIYSKDNDKFIGTIKIGHIDWRTGVCDVGIILGNAEYRGKGYAKEAMIIACDYAFRVLSLRKITGGTYSDNIAMIKTFLGLGFMEEGKRRKELLVEGVFMDHVLFGIFKEEFYKKVELK